MASFQHLLTGRDKRPHRGFSAYPELTGRDYREVAEWYARFARPSTSTPSTTTMDVLKQMAEVAKQQGPRFR